MNVLPFLLNVPRRIFRKGWGKPLGEKAIIFIERLLFKMFNIHDRVIGCLCLVDEELRFREVFSKALV